LVDEMGRLLHDPETPARAKIAAFTALRKADQAQWERDRLEEAGKDPQQAGDDCLAAAAAVAIARAVGKETA
jgi:hypothetical protein